jgi:hypothetical protein
MALTRAAPMGSEKQAGRNRLVHRICRFEPSAVPASTLAGWLDGSYRVSSHVSLDILRSLQVCPAERTEDHRLLMKLPLLTAESLVRGRHGPKHKRSRVAVLSVKRPIVPGLQAVLQYFAAWFGEHHWLSSPVQSNRSLSSTRVNDIGY